MKLIEIIYYNSPVFMQNIFTSMYGIKLYSERYGKIYNQYLDELLESQWFSEEKLQELQLEKLKTMLIHCQTNVPYYQNLFKKINFNPDKMKDISELGKIPIITKDVVIARYNEFLANNYNNKNTVIVNTSGSTGTPLRLVISKDGRKYNYAFFSRYKTWVGLEKNSIPVNITFAGRVLQKGDNNKPPFWRSNRVLNNTQFSSYHLSEKNLPYYVNKIVKLKPVFIDSYPSSIYTVANYLEKTGNSGIFPKFIITSSETLLEHQRNLIEKVFQCKVFDQYGSAEQVAFICQCGKGKYHMNSEYGITEFLDLNGKATIPGEAGEMICTGLTNYAMPLVRYNTGDSGIPTGETCNCGRKFPIVERIIGRTDDQIITKDGRYIGRLDPIFKGISTNSIKETQIIQEGYENIKLMIVKSNMFDKSDTDKIVLELKKRIGEQCSIAIEFVDSIPRTKSGKFRAIMSKISSGNNTKCVE